MPSPWLCPCLPILPGPLSAPIFSPTFITQLSICPPVHVPFGPPAHDLVGTSVCQALFKGSTVPGEGSRSLKPLVQVCGSCSPGGSPLVPNSGLVTLSVLAPLQTLHTVLQSLPHSSNSPGVPICPRSGLRGVSTQLLGTGPVVSRCSQGGRGEGPTAVTSAAAFSSSSPFPPGSP